MEVYLSQLNGFIVGLYASTPNPLGVDCQFDYDLISLSKEQVLHTRGLEIPFYGLDGIAEKYSQPKLLSAFDPNWLNVITCIPSTVIHQKSDPMFGLASIDEQSRLSAAKKFKEASNLIKDLNDYFGRRAISHIQVCSSPSSSANLNRSSGDALRHSLEELIIHDWEGAILNIEHCDSKSGITAQKGFLDLEDEIEVLQRIKATQRDCGIVVNWGRSAIEYRDPKLVVNHIEMALDADLLNGLIFSGVSNREDSLYGYWEDTHPSVSNDPEIQYYVQESLLTPAEIYKCLEKVDNKESMVIGHKIHIRPNTADNLAVAVQFNQAMSHILYREWNRVRSRK